MSRKVYLSVQHEKEDRHKLWCYDNRKYTKQEEEEIIYNEETDNTPTFKTVRTGKACG
jgi:hypothetical protein